MSTWSQIFEALGWNPIRLALSIPIVLKARRMDVRALRLASNLFRAGSSPGGFRWKEQLARANADEFNRLIDEDYFRYQEKVHRWRDIRRDAAWLGGKSISAGADLGFFVLAERARNSQGGPTKAS